MNRNDRTEWMGKTIIYYHFPVCSVLIVFSHLRPAFSIDLNAFLPVMPC